MLVLQSETEPTLAALGAWSLNHWITRKVPPAPALVSNDGSYFIGTIHLPN